MGSLISGFIAEIFLQYYEDYTIKHHLEDKNIIFSNRYIDYVLMLFDSRRTTAEQIGTYMNSIHQHLTFKLTCEENNSISYLDLTLTRHNTSIISSIFRKPTITDTTIHYTSNHPLEHKLAAFGSLVNSMQKLSLTQKARKQEKNTIPHIAISNGYPVKLIDQLQHKTLIHNGNNTQDNQPVQNNKKWVIFKYYSPLVRKITNIFKNTNLQITYRTTNTLWQILNTNNKHMIKYSTSGIYS
jgi:hypothetical protein